VSWNVVIARFMRPSVFKAASIALSAELLPTNAFRFTRFGIHQDRI
jgi:hypothetical protein